MQNSLLLYLRSELRWGLDHADERYAVLNACRACAYAATGRLLSKVDGARWWSRTRGPRELDTRAHDAQVAGASLGPATPEARTFVMGCIAELEPPQ